MTAFASGQVLMLEIPPEPPQRSTVQRMGSTDRFVRGTDGWAKDSVTGLRAARRYSWLEVLTGGPVRVVSLPLEYEPPGPG